MAAAAAAAAARARSLSLGETVADMVQVFCAKLIGATQKA